MKKPNGYLIYLSQNVYNCFKTLLFSFFFFLNLDKRSSTIIFCTDYCNSQKKLVNSRWRLLFPHIVVSDYSYFENTLKVLVYDYCFLKKKHEKEVTNYCLQEKQQNSFYDYFALRSALLPLILSRQQPMTTSPPYLSWVAPGRRPFENSCKLISLLRRFLVIVKHFQTLNYAHTGDQQYHTLLCAR